MHDELRKHKTGALQLQTSEVGRGSTASQRKKESPRAKERAEKKQRRVKASPVAPSDSPTRGGGDLADALPPMCP